MAAKNKKKRKKTQFSQGQLVHHRNGNLGKVLNTGTKLSVVQFYLNGYLERQEVFNTHLLTVDEYENRPNPL